MLAASGGGLAICAPVAAASRDHLCCSSKPPASSPSLDESGATPNPGSPFSPPTTNPTCAATPRDKMKPAVSTAQHSIEKPPKSHRASSESNKQPEEPRHGPILPTLPSPLHRTPPHTAYSSSSTGGRSRRAPSDELDRFPCAGAEPLMHTIAVPRDRAPRPWAGGARRWRP
jgi:hypothetical protein